MQTYKEQDITIDVYIDINEFGKEFYGMPDNAIADEEMEKEMWGFACIDTKTISIFLPSDYNKIELAETVAHELGHIVELPYPTNPEQINGNDELHELKANHYQDFYKTVTAIMEIIDRPF